MPSSGSRTLSVGRAPRVKEVRTVPNKSSVEWWPFVTYPAPRAAPPLVKKGTELKGKKNATGPPPSLVSATGCRWEGVRRVLDPETHPSPGRSQVGIRVLPHCIVTSFKSFSFPQFFFGLPGHHHHELHGCAFWPPLAGSPMHTKVASGKTGGHRHPAMLEESMSALPWPSKSRHRHRQAQVRRQRNFPSSRSSRGASQVSGGPPSPHPCRGGTPRSWILGLMDGFCAPTPVQPPMLAWIGLPKMGPLLTHTAATDQHAVWSPHYKEKAYDEVGPPWPQGNQVPASWLPWDKLCLEPPWQCAYPAGTGGPESAASVGRPVAGAPPPCASPWHTLLWHGTGPSPRWAISCLSMGRRLRPQSISATPPPRLMVSPVGGSRTACIPSWHLRTPCSGSWPSPNPPPESPQQRCGQTPQVRQPLRYTQSRGGKEKPLRMLTYLITYTWAKMAVPFWLWMFAHIILASASTASSKVSQFPQKSSPLIAAISNDSNSVFPKDCDFQDSLPFLPVPSHFGAPWQTTSRRGRRSATLGWRPCRTNLGPVELIFGEVIVGWVVELNSTKKTNLWKGCHGLPIWQDLPTQVALVNVFSATKKHWNQCFATLSHAGINQGLHSSNMRNSSVV